MTTALLTGHEEVAAHLHRRGLTDETVVEVAELTGGVSGSCQLVTTTRRRLVLKQALPRLRTAAEWFADPARVLAEAAGLELARSLTPGSVPEVVDVDADELVLLMAAAPQPHRSYRSALLDADAGDEHVLATAAHLGDLLGRWHRQPAPSQVGDVLPDDRSGLESLRIRPFHRRVQQLHPGLAPALEDCIAQLHEQRDGFVHGDFSPKNVLVGPGWCWVIDFEVAHVGAAVFDRAFLHCHLLLKAAHRRDVAALFARVAHTFDSCYELGAPGRSEPLLAWQTAALLLARVDGASPADYLDEQAADRVRRTAQSVLATDAVGLTDLWSRLEEL